MDTVCYGSTGETVKALQSALNRAGYAVTVDGMFGAKTATTVKNFQAKYGLLQDGVVGPNTWDKLSPYMTEDVVQAINDCVAKIQASPEFKRFMELIGNG